MRILGIETSCDETAAAVVTDGRQVESSVILSQVARHRPYGGVVPEIASRAHVEALPHVIRDALDRAGRSWEDIDALAVTYGPGLASSLLVGVTAAKALALRLGKPLIPVNHLRGHVHSLYLHEEAPDPKDQTPILMLLVSGGHTALLHVQGPTTVSLLGQTLDDAAGEALDKGASLLSLGYPGGPAIEKAATDGTAHADWFPAPARLSAKSRTGGLDPATCFSFSGLKTSLLVRLEKDDAASSRRADYAASYQEAVMQTLADRIEQGLGRVSAEILGCVGGVAKNARLRSLIDGIAGQRGLRVLHAPLSYCTDNAAMIAGYAGAFPEPLARDQLGGLDVLPSLAVTA